jgi:hypothetical protein
MTRTIYCTSFCNHGHVIETGRPVNHECYILPPAALREERAGNTDAAIEILQKQGKGRLVQGRA